MKKYHVLEISKGSVLFLSRQGFTQDRSRAQKFSEQDAQRITSEYNRSYCDFSKSHYNYVDTDKTKNMRSHL